MKVNISFGCLSPPVRDQLKDQGLSLNDGDAKRIQNLYDALNLISLHGLVSDSAIHTARKRLMKKIVTCAFLPTDPGEQNES